MWDALGGVLLALAMALAPGNAPAREVRPDSNLTVCLTLSARLGLDARQQATIHAELNAIWNPLGMTMTRTSNDTRGCDRLVLVRDAAEARPEDLAVETALGWVPFVPGQARRIIFLSVRRARTLIDTISPGTRTEGLTRILVARLLGRTVAHELGHILLNTQQHRSSGLMRARYRASDVLNEPASSYTLDATERAQLFTRTSGGQRLVQR